jgi:hypothetical protein
VGAGFVNADQEGVVGKPDDGALFSFVSVEEVSTNGVERSFSLTQGSHTHAHPLELDTLPTQKFNHKHASSVGGGQLCSGGRR